MEFKGTPGPWEVYIGWNTDGVKSKEGEFICRTENFKSSEIFVANAQLISKAPEMLEMLNNYLNDLMNIVPQSPARDNRIKQVEELIKSATELKEKTK